MVDYFLEFPFMRKTELEIVSVKGVYGNISDANREP
jgi:hypothetical protein